MRIAFAFTIMLLSAILWMVDTTQAVYDFRTEVREDDFTVTTAANVTSANVTLLKEVYDDDTDTIGYTSSIAEAPVYSAYNTVTRQLLTANLTAGTSRTLTVNYDIDALVYSTSLNTFLDWWPFVWIILVIIFPIAAIVAIFTGR